MKHILKKLPIFLLMVWPYVFFLGMLWPNTPFFGIYCVLTLVICVMNMMHAGTYIGDNKARELSFWGMLIKLVHMPFHVTVMLLSVVVFMTVVTNTAIRGIPPIVMFLVIFAFFFMITTSAYCAKGALAGKEQGIIKKETAMMLSICSFMFIADVICAIIIYNNVKKSNKKYL